MMQVTSCHIKFSKLFCVGYTRNILLNDVAGASVGSNQIFDAFGRE